MLQWTKPSCSLTVVRGMKHLFFRSCYCPPQRPTQCLSVPLNYVVQDLLVPLYPCGAADDTITLGTCLGAVIQFCSNNGAAGITSLHESSATFTSSAAYALRNLLLSIFILRMHVQHQDSRDTPVWYRNTPYIYMVTL